MVTLEPFELQPADVMGLASAVEVASGVVLVELGAEERRMSRVRLKGGDGAFDPHWIPVTVERERAVVPSHAFRCEVVGPLGVLAVWVMEGHE